MPGSYSEETDMAKKATDQGIDDTNRDDSNTVKNGDEPMTGAQRSYLKTLSDEAKVPFDENLTKAEASKRIDELRDGNERVEASG